MRITSGRLSSKKDWWLRLCIHAMVNFETGRCFCALVLCLLALLGGCASLPSAVERPPSHAVTDGADTRLGRLAAASLATALPELARPGLSGARLLPDGPQALEARIALIQAAQKSVDAQYYLIEDDRSGRQFLEALQQAADRGVRVRLLVDDLYTGHSFAMLDGLALRPNVALRLFNPLPVRNGSVRTRVLLSLHEFPRINRRMHNKLLIADNSFAISGGRNVADEYFGRSGPANFIDMDVLTAGPVVRDMSDHFDVFWNSPQAWPWQRFAAGSGDGQVISPPSASSVDAQESDAIDEASLDVFGRTSLGRQLREGAVSLRAAPISVIADAPGKADPQVAASAALAGSLAFLDKAQSDVLVVSPYFVPATQAMELLQKSSKAGLNVTVITNSLGATDEPLVHFGYARLRATMVKTGVKLYELMPAGDVRRDDAAESRPSLGRLHAKMAIVDRRWLYVGSMNMDRRSAYCNTEIGLVIDDPALAGEVLGLMQRERSQASFQVRIGGPDQSLQWTFLKAGQEQVLAREPNVGWFTRVRWPFASLLVSDDFL